MADRELEAEDLKVILEAQRKHLAEALRDGHRVLAHGFVDAIIDIQNELEDISKGTK